MQTSRIFLLSRANSRSPLQKGRHINHIIPLRAGRNAALVSAITTCIMKLETDDLSGCGEPIPLEGVAFSRPELFLPSLASTDATQCISSPTFFGALRLIFCSPSRLELAAWNSQLAAALRRTGSWSRTKDQGRLFTAISVF